MDPERWRQVEQLYLAAVEKRPDERAAFLEQACSGDSSVREEVESLLSFTPNADKLLQATVQEVASQASSDTAPTTTLHFEKTAGETKKLGRYQLLEKIGKGGMGVVYRAMDPAIGRVVAIKTIRLNDDAGEGPEQRARLLRESQAGGRLSHPNIVAVHDISEEGETSYIVMEFVHGRTLESVLREDSSLQSSSQALRIVQDCAAALDYAHSRGVVHRDVKPANIMLQDDGVVKIADFGIAKISQSLALTQSGSAVGSPHYMAPEQWRGEAVTGQADQYALATVAYALLTGRRPFEGDSVATLAAMTLYEEPPAAITFNSRLNPMVDVVLRKALAKTAAARYSNCSEFAQELRGAWEYVSPPVPTPAPVLTPAAVPPQLPVAAAPPAGNGQKWTVAALATALLAILCVAGWLVYQRKPAGNAKAPLEVAKTAPAPQPATPPTPVSQPEAPVQKAQPTEAVVKPRRKTSTPVAQAEPPPPPLPEPPQPAAEGPGDALLKQGDYAQAANYFTRAIATKPNYHNYFGRATAYRELDQSEKAISDYTEAIRLKPDSAFSYHDRALCEMRLGLDQRAADDYDQALKMDPTRPRFWNGRGMIYLKKGGYKKAKEFFTKAIELNRNFSDAYQNRSKAELKLNETAAAEEDMKKAKALKDQKAAP
jgi:serine/threonine-protein kinase